jgi:hypothetical protein
MYMNCNTVRLNGVDKWLLQTHTQPVDVGMYEYIAGEGLNRPQHRDHPWSIVLSPILSPLLVPRFE